MTFLALAECLKPNALQLRAWRSNETIMSSNMDELCQKTFTFQCFMSLSVANHLSAVLMQLQMCAYESKTTYSCMFTTWSLFLSKELRALFYFFPDNRYYNGWQSVLIISGILA